MPPRYSLGGKHTTPINQKYPKDVVRTVKTRRGNRHSTCRSNLGWRQIEKVNAIHVVRVTLGPNKTCVFYLILSSFSPTAVAIHARGFSWALSKGTRVYTTRYIFTWKRHPCTLPSTLLYLLYTAHIPQHIHATLLLICCMYVLLPSFIIILVCSMFSPLLFVVTQWHIYLGSRSSPPAHLHHSLMVWNKWAWLYQAMGFVIAFTIISHWLTPDTRVTLQTSLIGTHIQKPWRSINASRHSYI